MPTNTELLADLIDAVPTGVVVFELEDADKDDELVLVLANSAADRLTGVAFSAQVGKKLSVLSPSTDTARWKVYAEVCRTRQARDLGVIVNAEGHVFSVLATPVGSRQVAIVFSSQDALREAEDEAQKLNRFLDSIIEHIPAMVFMKDATELRFERFNRAGEELLGMPRAALMGKSDYDFFPRDQADFFVAKDRHVLSSGVVDIPEEPIQTKFGERWLHTRKIPLLDEHGQPRHLLGVSIDITEAKRARDALHASHEELVQQLRQAQKMEAIGRLAGGIAHDFNNILSAILSYSAIALGDLATGHPVRGELDEITRAAERASQLTRQLLAFSRRQLLEPRVVDLNQELSRIERMLRRLIGEDIELVCVFGAELFRVKVDVGQIEQVILNLVVNARDAMPEGGRLTLTTENVTFDAKRAPEHIELGPGKYVVVELRDTGVGMSEEVKSHLFEPFFTTKEQGRGTGLGLSTVFGIVKQSGGAVVVHSEPGQGATFRLYFPAVSELVVADTNPTPANRDSGGQTLLVVEDEEQVRAVVLKVLRRAGYRVIDADSGPRALATASEYEGRIDLLLTDVVMPKMSGPELAAKLEQIRPGLRVLFMSGYTDDAALKHGILQAELAFIQKPLTPDTLLKKVREVLESEPRSAELSQ